MWHGVFAVLYTYDRRELISRCLVSVLNQTVPPERIVLIDNGCTDGTEDYLRSSGLLNDRRISYVRLPTNTGAAGGLRAGITHAFERGCEWVWVMDDDVVCEPETLQRLKEAYERNFADTGQLGFLVSRLVGPDGRANNVPQIDDWRDARDVRADWSERLAHGLARVRIATLTSALIPRTTLLEFGAPRSDFFIWGEDTDYALRVTQSRPAFLVGNSRALHLRGVPGELDILHETDPGRIDYFFYLYRNTSYLRRTYWPAHCYWLFVGKSMLHLWKSVTGNDHRWRRSRAILTGMLAGLTFKPRHQPLSSSREAAAPAQRKSPQRDHDGLIIDDIEGLTHLAQKYRH